MSMMRALHNLMVAGGYGDSLTYHTGFLALDRGQHDALAGFTRTEAQQRINSLAASAYRWAEDGYLLLTQVRIGPALFAYIATRTAKRMPAGMEEAA